MLGFVSEGSDFSVGQAGIVLAVNVPAIPHGLVQEAVRIYSCGLRLWDLVVPRVKDCFGHWFSGKSDCQIPRGPVTKPCPAHQNLLMQNGFRAFGTFGMSIIYYTVPYTSIRYTHTDTILKLK